MTLATNLPFSAQEPREAKLARAIEQLSAQMLTETFGLLELSSSRMFLSYSFPVMLWSGPIQPTQATDAWWSWPWEDSPTWLSSVRGDLIPPTWEPALRYALKSAYSGLKA